MRYSCRVLAALLCLALFCCSVTIGTPRLFAAESETPQGWERTDPPLDRLPPRGSQQPSDNPIRGLRQMLRTMDALIAAFQDESETFTRLIEVYKNGGEPWQRLQRCINETWDNTRETGQQ